MLNWLINNWNMTNKLKLMIDEWKQLKSGQQNAKKNE